MEISLISKILLDFHADSLSYSSAFPPLPEINTFALPISELHQSCMAFLPRISVGETECDGGGGLNGTCDFTLGGGKRARGCHPSRSGARQERGGDSDITSWVLFPSLPLHPLPGQSMPGLKLQSHTKTNFCQSERLTVVAHNKTKTKLSIDQIIKSQFQLMN